MAVTGRLALLVALGALVVGLLRALAARGAGRVRRRSRWSRSWTRWRRSPSGACASTASRTRPARRPCASGRRSRSRCGWPTPGAAARRCVLRDAWEPSAGAVPARHRLVVPAGERRRVVTTLTPTRRGDRDAVRVTVRSLGPLGLAARQGGRVVPARVRVLPPFGSRRHLPSRLARMRELDGRRAIQVRGQGTEFDSLREYVAGDDVRSIDWRASARSTELVVRTWRPERDRHVLRRARHRAELRGPGRRRTAARRRPGHRAAARRAGLPRRRPRRPPRARPRGPGLGARGHRGRSAARARDRHGAAGAAAGRDRHAPARRVRPRPRRAAQPRRAGHGSRRGGRDRGPRPGAREPAAPAHRAARRRRRPGARDDGRRARGRRGRLHGGGRRDRPRRPAPDAPSASAAGASRSSTRGPTSCPRPSPTATSPSRRRGGSS